VNLLLEIGILGGKVLKKTEHLQKNRSIINELQNYKKSGFPFFFPMRLWHDSGAFVCGLWMGLLRYGNILVGWGEGGGGKEWM
jgi:hypothetical protein